MSIPNTYNIRVLQNETQNTHTTSLPQNERKTPLKTPKQDKDQDLQLSVGLKSPTVHRRTATAPTHHLYPHKTGSELLRVW